MCDTAGEDDSGWEKDSFGYWASFFEYVFKHIVPYQVLENVKFENMSNLLVYIDYSDEFEKLSFAVLTTRLTLFPKTFKNLLHDFVGIA